MECEDSKTICGTRGSEDIDMTDMSTALDAFMSDRGDRHFMMRDLLK